MGDKFNDDFDGEKGFNIVFVDDNAMQRKMVINGLKRVVNKKNETKEPEEQLKLNFKTAVNCGYAIKLVKQLKKENKRIDLILMDNDFDIEPVDCTKKNDEYNDEYIYEICCDNDKNNNGNNTTKNIREKVGYMGAIYSISSNADKSEWVDNFITDCSGTGAVGRDSSGILHIIDGLIKEPIPSWSDTSFATIPDTPIKQKATQMMSDIISKIIHKKSRIIPENGGKKTKKRLKNKNKTNKRFEKRQSRLRRRRLFSILH